MFATISSEAREWKAKLEAISKSQAEIEFKLDGTIVTANENFLKALGYTLDEIKGKHHSIFVDSAYRDSDEYAEFWSRLRHGEFQSRRSTSHKPSLSFRWMGRFWLPMQIFWLLSATSFPKSKASTIRFL